MDNTIFMQLPVWQKNHIEVCIEKELFKGKKVLEVGGRTLYEVTKTLEVESWTGIDPAFKQDWEPFDNYRLLKRSVLDFGEDEEFDFIFATNSFEHINGFDKGVENMYRILKKGGKLSALLGPIWSCYKGSHTGYKTKDNEIINFNNIKLPPWAHLIYSQEEIKEILLKSYSQEIAQDISSWIFNTDFLNRLFYDDYRQTIFSSKFEVLEFRDWHTSKFPHEDLQTFLENKYNKKNFSTVSIKMLLKKNS